ncbi:MAG: hypothetical protein H6719_21450 [Sandaracinaceae bacterium]|nr:hypothetical protein [Sandaracinaceae bacterium]
MGEGHSGRVSVASLAVLGVLGIAVAIGAVAMVQCEAPATSPDAATLAADAGSEADASLDAAPATAVEGAPYSEAEPVAVEPTPPPDEEVVAPLPVADDAPLATRLLAHHGVEADDSTALAIVDATVEHGRHTWVLYRVMGEELFFAELDRSDDGTAAEAARVLLEDPGEESWAAARTRYGAHASRWAPYLVAAAAGTPRWVYFLGQLAGEQVVRSEPIYDLAMVGADAEWDWACEVATELRARDLDGDGELELTAILGGLRVPLALAAQYEEEEQVSECGAVALILGADFEVQARFLREYHHDFVNNWNEQNDTRESVWRLGDTDGDGHADLHVVTRWTGRTYDAPDGCDPDEDPTPEHEEVDRGRSEHDCPYDVASDRWVCPALGPREPTGFAPDAEIMGAER